MLIFGIILTAIGLLLLVSYLFSRINCRTKAEAVIVKIIEKKIVFRGSTVKEYTPVFTYSVNNKEYSQKADCSSMNPKKYSVGQRVTVFVNGNRPETMRYGKNIGIPVFGLILTALGVFTVVLTFM